MKEIKPEKCRKPISHGFLLGNGKFVTPAEMRIMESLGVIRTTRV